MLTFEVSEEMNIKRGWILMLFYFITTASGAILITLLSAALAVFAGNAYIGSDMGEVIHNLKDVGITENTFLSIVGFARWWILLAPLGFFIFAFIEFYDFLKTREGK